MLALRYCHNKPQGIPGSPLKHKSVSQQRVRGAHLLVLVQKETLTLLPLSHSLLQSCLLLQEKDANLYALNEYGMCRFRQPYGSVLRQQCCDALAQGMGANA